MNQNFNIRRSTAALTLFFASLGGGLVAVVATGQHPHIPAVMEIAHAANTERNGMISFAPVVKDAAPAVVQIESTKIIKASDQKRGRNPFSDDPMFRQFFGEGNAQPRDRRESGLGSGVLVSRDGYILTNSHVVEGSQTVKVTLSDRREFTAKVIGTDPKTDIAVVKIDAANLPILPLADSSKAQVGDVVLAIGNPFGIGQSVSMGIVSATSRSLGGSIEQYEDFIQTDAAINRGNSGGALINSNGELIGINTAILAPGGANAGVGFAVPVNLAKNVMNQLVKSGKVTRGYIGAGVQDVDSSLAQAFHLPKVGGVALTQIQANSPASKAGLQSGDVIEEVNGTPVVSASGLRLAVASYAPGTTVDMKGFRDGKERDFKVTLEERPTDEALSSGAGKGVEEGDNGGQKSGLTGVSVDALTPQIARQIRVPDGIKGVVVTDVEEASAAAEAGLNKGDVITSVNRKPIADVTQFNSMTKSGNQVVLTVNRGGGTLFIVVESK